ncbi:MAG: PEP-CTERM sorting domain-containing protein [Planctomycetota bacterium]
MKKLTLTLLVLFVAGTAMAAINTEKPLGPLNLYIDGDGAGIMVNDGAEAFTFDGYSIASDGGNILPDDWMSIPQNVEAGGLGGGDDIGQTMLDAFSWAEMARTANLVSEAHLSSAATLAPLDGIGLGNAFPGGTQDDLTFTYVNSATQESYEGEVIPEPATMSLLALGGLALIRRRR